MPTIAMAFPIPPEKLDTWRSGMREIAGPRREEFDASRRGASALVGPGPP